MAPLFTFSAQSIAGGVPLRIEALGASITFGIASTDGNGYRKSLRDRLRGGGSPVKMVGSTAGGTMKDNPNEGWPGLRVDEIQVKATSVAQNKPNIVLINAGTNDAIQNKDIATIQGRMNSLLNDVYSYSPTATIILSALVPSRDLDIQARAQAINQQYRDLAGSLQVAGKRIAFLDTQNAFDGLTAADLSGDGIHPSDAGYAKFAELWYNAVKQADELGFIQPAEFVDGIPDDGIDD